MTSYILPHNLFREAPHIQVEEMRKAIDLHKLFLDYLWAKYSFKYSLEDIDDVQDRIDYFEERACSPVVQSDIEDNLQAAEELSQNLSLMIGKLVLEETCFLIKKREYFYACVEQVDPLNGQLALIYEIELLEEEIQRSLV